MKSPSVLHPGSNSPALARTKPSRRRIAILLLNDAIPPCSNLPRLTRATPEGNFRANLRYQLRTTPIFEETSL
jgi:hypothetical protein